MFIRRAVVSAIVSAGLLAAPDGCNQDDQLHCPSEPVAGEQRLIVRGDSLGAMARGNPENPGAESQLITEQAPGVVCYFAVGGTYIDDHQAAFGQVDETDCVIAELGTNTLANKVWADARFDLHQAATTLEGAQHQVWLTINTTGAGLIGGNYETRVDWFNAELEAMDADEANWPNLSVYDWAEYSAGHPEWLNLPDRLHYNAEGTLQFRRALVRSARMCPEPIPAPEPTTTTTTAPSTTTSTTVPETTTTTLVEATTTTSLPEETTTTVVEP